MTVTRNLRPLALNIMDVRDLEAREEDERERRMADALHDRWPGRWHQEASPRRMRRDLERDREWDERNR